MKLKLEREGAPQSSDEEPSNDFIDIQESKQIIGQVTELEFVEVEEQSFHCLDGRSREAALFAPGGDFGEFVTALLTYEEMKAIEIT